LTDLIDRTIGQFRQLSERSVDIPNNILINVLGTADVLQKFSLCVAYMLSTKWNDPLFYVPLCIRQRVLLTIS